MLVILRERSDRKISSTRNELATGKVKEILRSTLVRNSHGLWIASSRNEVRDLRWYSVRLLKPAEDPSSLRSFGMTRLAGWFARNLGQVISVSSLWFSARRCGFARDDLISRRRLTLTIQHSRLNQWNNRKQQLFAH